MIFPWQENQWQQLQVAKKQERLPHALLLTGLNGTGKSIFADAFSRMMLCSQPAQNGLPCNECHPCRLIIGRAHPNVLWVEPEKEGQAIKVDQIREVSEFVSQSSMRGEYRMVIITPANNMNTNAANALLKTLEEPASGAMLILISHQSAGLPATILSRCQRVAFPMPPKTQALNWLQGQVEQDAALLLNLANGAPLAALKLKEGDTLEIRKELFQGLSALSNKQADPLKLATKLQSHEPLMLIDFFLTWTMDILRLQLGDHNIINQDHNDELNALTTRIKLDKTNKLMVYLQQLRGQLYSGLNLNKQLLLENALLRWMECL
ncbi:MAG: DNA polymerase III subunit delta' [Gammaproteobacteria bacterium]